MRHSFYCGVENIFKRVVVELDEEDDRSGQWHRRLLHRMTQPQPHRPQVISVELADALKSYLDFRHFFRSAYTFQVKWERMAPLVLEWPRVFRCHEAELEEFLKTTEGKE